jgi:excisionase family DNA binding protein
MAHDKGQFELPLAETAHDERGPESPRRRTPKLQAAARAAFAPARALRAVPAASLDLPRLYTAEEVARHLRVSVRTVKRFIASRKLTATRFGRTPRISEVALQAFLRDGTTKSCTARAKPNEQRSW